MRTAANLAALEDELQRNCGDLFDACRKVGLSAMFVTRWCKDDKDVDERLKEAARVGGMQIYTEVVRRAVRGVDEDVFYKGLAVAKKRVYSDGLLGKLADAKLPEFAKGEGAGGNTFNGPTQINIMPRAENYEQWLQMRSATAAHNAGEAPKLAAPGSVIDAEFTLLPTPQAPLAGLGI